MLFVNFFSWYTNHRYTVRDRFARKMFGKPLSGLTPEELDEIRNTIPKIIAEAEPEQIKYEEPPRH